MRRVEKGLQWVAVDSSHVSEMAYDAEAGSLHVRFKNGAEYRYDGVSPRVAAMVTRSPRPGQAFVSLVRGSYVETRVN